MSNINENNQTKPKIIVIVGTTASGKTSLAIKLAQKYNGEIISADSRQVYRGMDIGTGKDLKDYEIISRIVNDKIQSVKIPYHLIDIINPQEKFDLAKWIKLAEKAIQDILLRKKLPIIVGGTGLYIQALIDGFQLSSIQANNALRKKLEKKSEEELLTILTKINKFFTTRLNNSEKNNKRRLIRYIEVLGQKGSVAQKKKNNKYDFLIIGATFPREELKERIYNRLINRLEKDGMVEEVKNLHKKGLSQKRLESFGLEYKFISKYLQNKLSYDEMVERLNIAIRQFAKRQMTWLKRWEKQGTKINWINNFKEVDKIINQNTKNKRG
jgi:tRNA dimethylallyltransferase